MRPGRSGNAAGPDLFTGETRGGNWTNPAPDGDNGKVTRCPAARKDPACHQELMPARTAAARRIERRVLHRLWRMAVWRVGVAAAAPGDPGSGERIARPACRSGAADPPRHHQPGSAGVALRLGILALTVAAGGTWFLAERMIVDRDDRLNWDIAWIAAAAIAIVGACWLAYDAYRRGQTQGLGSGLAGMGTASNVVAESPDPSCASHRGKPAAIRAASPGSASGHLRSGRNRYARRRRSSRTPFVGRSRTGRSRFRPTLPQLGPRGRSLP